MVPITSKSRLVSGGFAAALFLLLLPGMGRAANVQVVCPGGGPGAFSSVSAALNALDPHGPNTITVSGTCVENIFIDSFANLFITSAPGQTAIITAADPTHIVFQAYQSHAILVVGLTFQGGSTGVLLNQGSNATLVNCTMQQNSNEGLHMQMGSTLVMENSTIQDNQGSGIFEGGGSNATMATNPNERIRVLRNGGDGIDVEGSYFQVNFGTLDVENNAGAAIFQNGGRLLIFGGGGVGGGNLFQGNGEGIDIFEAGSAHFFGRNVIRNNGDVGLQVLGSSVLFTGGLLPDGTLNAAIVEGHATLGVNVVRLGELTMSGPHQIQNNGTATADPTLRGGIRVNRSSLTLFNSVQISNNVGPGVRADFNAGTSVGNNVTVSNNSEEGVRVREQSVADFVPPLTVAGNGQASISCDTTSLVFGDVTGITNIDCSRIQRAAGPPRPGRVVN